jgi:hypothetical protein
MRCTVLPLPDHQVAVRIDGTERLRWHHGPQYPRPFLFPLRGPASGESLTRMGHPGAPDHDHHRSVWFAHEKVSGVNFWSDRGPARVRQTDWLCYQDGDAEAVVAVKLRWFDGHDPKPLLDQLLVLGVRPGPDGETFVELQSTFTPTAATLEFGKTNFGFLAVRVAKGLSAFFGTGVLTNSDGKVGEPALFAQPAAWVDYSSPAEGITYFDHPTNPGHPTSWHVREDGWMGAANCLREPRSTTRQSPLALRYLLHAHRGKLDADRATATFAAFAGTKPWELVKSPAKHTAWGVKRAG